MQAPEGKSIPLDNYTIMFNNVSMDRNAALQKAIDMHGNASALARALGVSFVAVYKWRKGQVPPERALEIERLTDGAVTRQDLRPDLFGLAALTKKKRSA